MFFELNQNDILMNGLLRLSRGYYNYISFLEVDGGVVYLQVIVKRLFKIHHIFKEDFYKLFRTLYSRHSHQTLLKLILLRKPPVSLKLALHAYLVTVIRQRQVVPPENTVSLSPKILPAATKRLRSQFSEHQWKSLQEIYVSSVYRRNKYKQQLEKEQQQKEQSIWLQYREILARFPVHQVYLANTYRGKGEQLFVRVAYQPDAIGMVVTFYRPFSRESYFVASQDIAVIQKTSDIISLQASTSS